MTLELKPYQHQQETIDKLNEHFKNNNKALIVLPSGSGKTHTIAFHINQVRPRNFLYIVHRNEILYQTIKVFKHVCSFLKDNDIGIINQKNKDYDKPYLFATIQTLSISKNLKLLPKNIQYVVIDEYHHAAAISYKKFIDYIKPKYLVGLTATPFRLDKKDILKPIDNNIVQDIDLFDAIKNNLVVPFHYIGLHDNIDYSEIKFSGYSYSITDLDKKLIIHRRDEAIIDIYNTHLKNQKRPTIIFCNSLVHIKRLVSKMNGKGIKTVGINHKQSIIKRRKIIEDFRNNIYQVLCTRDILNEGVDFPECEAVIFLRPTISKTIFLQQLGRGLRKNKNKTNVLVLDFIGNYHKAFEKQNWFKDFIKNNSTVHNNKPNYEYNPPNTIIEFDQRVIDMFEIQRLSDVRHGITKKEIYDDYMNCCKQENKSILSQKQYSNSKYRKYRMNSLLSLYGKFTQFLIENNIDPNKKLRNSRPRNELIDFFTCKDKKKLITNYYKVKKYWIESKPIIRNNSNHLPLKLLSDNMISDYHSNCYRSVFGSYGKFLLSIKEVSEINIINNNKSHDIQVKYIKKMVKQLRKKLSGNYFSYEDWIKEYGNVLMPAIRREYGGFHGLREYFGMKNKRKQRFDRIKP